MTAAQLKDALHQDVLQFLEGVTEESLQLSYDGIVTVLQNIKDSFLSLKFSMYSRLPTGRT